MSFAEFAGTVIAMPQVADFKRYPRFAVLSVLIALVVFLFTLGETYNLMMSLFITGITSFLWLAFVAYSTSLVLCFLHPLWLLARLLLFFVSRHGLRGFLTILGLIAIVIGFLLDMLAS